MKKISIYGDHYSHSTGGYDPNDEWSRDSSHHHWDIKGAGEHVPKRCETFDSIETNVKGKAFALYTIHSSGDSFGRDENAYFTLHWIFDSYEKAQKAMDKIKEHEHWYHELNSWRPNKKLNKKQFRSEYSVDIDIEGERPLTISASWNGYFESLSEIDIYEFTIVD